MFVSLASATVEEGAVVKERPRPKRQDVHNSILLKTGSYHILSLCTYECVCVCGHPCPVVCVWSQRATVESQCSSTMCVGPGDRA